ncbi:MAG: NHLP bacteriocin export ABC transporter permease/ATPase subunit [Gemmatimonadaceae bacterium]
MRQTRTFARFTSAFGIGAEDEASSLVLMSHKWDNEQALSGHNAIILDDPNFLYVLTAGEVDLFYVRRETESRDGARRYVGTLRAGDVVAGAAASAATGNGVIVAVGFGGARMHRVSTELLVDETPEGSRIARALANGIAESIGRAMYRATVAPARHVEPMSSTQSFSQDTALTAGVEVLWFWTDSGELSLGGEVPLSGGRSYFPIARGMWVTVASESAELSVSDTHEMLDSGTVLETLSSGWIAFLAWTSQWFDREDNAERDRLARRAINDRTRHDRAIASLADLLQQQNETFVSVNSTDALINACALVFAAAHIPFHVPPHIAAVRGGIKNVIRYRDRVAAIISASFVRHRRVTLKGEWWKLDGGPLLGFLGEERVPVALISSASGGYTIQNALIKERLVVTEAVASRLHVRAYTFYRPLPAVPLKLRALVQLVAIDIWPDITRIVWFALAMAVLGLALPIVTGKMFSEVIPTADASNALTLFAALLAVALGTVAFEAARGFAFIRAQSRANSGMQAAIVDRLLALPTQFFRKFTVGDLATRADAVNSARQLLSNAVVTSLLGGALALTNLLLMFFIDLKLGFIAFVAMALGAGLTAIVTYTGLNLERQRLVITGRISSLIFELLNGVAKLHVAAAESRMFALWAVQFRELKSVAMKVGVSTTALNAFNDVLPTIASVAVFFVAAREFQQPDKLSTAEFIAFSAAFGAALTASTSVSNTLVSLLNIVPLLERITPILQATPEIGDSKPDPGAISGRIEFSHVSFGYVADAPLTIADVTFEIRPGEFVAFVGPSGAGKSTILRLLLGFERPTTGAVYYDGKDLASIDIASIRRQSAVVLQQSRLLAGDIYTNIVGASPLTMDDAWRAAELAGFADDVRRMPMEMRTVVSDGGSTLSGGQRQRLLIARALARSPRVVLFDEATSALDNRSQEIVTQSLERLQSTRVVIAHRLSTVMRADRIFVMERGRIVQHGRYEELVEMEGLFKQLAERQLV